MATVMEQVSRALAETSGPLRVLGYVVVGNLIAAEVALGVVGTIWAA